MPLKLKRVSSPPVSVSGNSVLFNGTNQYLTLTGQNLSTGNFTIESWVYFTATGTTGHIFNFGTNNSNRYMVWISNTGKFNIGACVGGTYTLNDSTFTPSINTWYHVAYVRSGGTSYLYVNGTQVGTNSAAIDSGTAWCIGTQNYGPAAGDYWKGYISNFRVVNGTAVYTASFSVPTAPLTAIANTSLLTCNAATIIDNSSNNFTITNNGTATVSSAVTPFTAPSYASTFKFKNVNNNRVVLAGTQRAIFGYGNTGTVTSVTNLVSNTGVVANDTTGVGTAREYPAATQYGTDKAIFGYGYINSNPGVSMTNLVSNTGVVSADTTGVGTARYSLAAAGYGSDKAIFGYGLTTVAVSVTNLVSNTGVVTTDTTGVGTARWALSAAGYGTDKAIFGYGYNGSSNFSITNLVSNTGVVSTDTTGVGTIRRSGAAAGYGTDKAIFGYGFTTSVVSIINLVSNTGIVATDTTGVGTARSGLATAGYGSDKAIFGYGTTGTNTAVTNLVSNTGVVASDTTGVGTARSNLAAAGFSTITIPAPSGGSFKKVYADPIIVYLTQKAIFGYGYNGSSNVSITNLVSNTGVVANDTTGVGTARQALAAAGYGADKAIFGYGYTGSNPGVSMTNLVSNTGVVSTDTTGVGSARYNLAAAGYGSDKAIFGYGTADYLGATHYSTTNLVSNTGVVATDTTGVGTGRWGLAAAGYGTNKAIFGYGQTSVVVSMTNLVSNTGVVATDTTGVGTARYGIAAAGYGTDKVIFGYGNSGTNTAITNLVSNTGVVATDTTGVGTARRNLAAAGYGTDKSIFGYGYTSAVVSMTNLVSNTGVVATDTTGVGTARYNPSAAGFSLT
jgi:hypothetical protein